MSALKNGLRRIARVPGVRKARHVSERAVAPYLRADLHQLSLDQVKLAQRLSELEGLVHVNQPELLNAIASSGGTARTLVRAIESGDAAVRAEMRPHIEAIAYILRRVETLRMEMMHELRYGQATATAEAVEPRIVNPTKIKAGDIRLNIGAGHITPDDYVNVDMRELPGIDVVAGVDNLPFDAGSVTEIFSSHVVEHFPEQQLRRTLLPYWVGLLKPGGTFRAIVPDFDAMTHAYSKGEMTFEALREVTYGSQEYEGDFHYNGFSPASLLAMLVDSGLENAKVVAQGRPNGLCLEFEIVATKPKI